MRLVLRKKKSKLKLRRGGCSLAPSSSLVLEKIRSARDGITAREIATKLRCDPLVVFRIVFKLQKKHAKLRSFWRANKFPDHGGPIQESCYVWRKLTLSSPG